MDLKTEYHLEEGRVVIFKRENSQFWQMRARAPRSGTYIWRSLKTTDLEKAKSAARKEYFKLEMKVEAGLPLKNTPMKNVIKDFLASIDLQVEKKSVSVHMRRLHNVNVDAHIMPFFEDMSIESVNTKTIHDFFESEINDADELPSSVTIRSWAGTLNTLLKFAVKKSLIKGVPLYDRPEGREAKRRACFTKEEWVKLSNLMPDWVENGSERFKYNRQVLHAYVKLMSLTGMRTNDMAKLKWKHITEFTKSIESGDPEWPARDIIYVSIIAFGKPTKRRKSRELIGQPNCRWQIKQWKNQSKFTDPDDFVFCLEKDVPFIPHQAFKQMLIDFDMLCDPEGDVRTPYSIRHMYATFALDSGIKIHLLANQMGTSVGIIEKHYGHIQIRDQVEKLAHKRQ